MQDFLTSTMGQIIVVLAIIILLVVIFKTSKKDNKNNVKALTYSAIAIAIAFVLNAFIVFKMPQGGSATLFSMLVIVLVAYWFGPKNGILAGLAFGLLNALYQPFIVHPIQFLLDYPLAFGMLGIAGFSEIKSTVCNGEYCRRCGQIYLSCNVGNNILLRIRRRYKCYIIFNYLQCILYRNRSYNYICFIVGSGVRNAFNRIKTNVN
jgi:energy-coupled thiamine transporter ThiT